MRVAEFQMHTSEARQWTADDDVQLLVQQLGSADNVHAQNVYFQEVHITNAVNVLVSRNDCKWFFDLVAIKLHELDAITIRNVDVYMIRFENEWLIWAKDQFDYPHVFNCDIDQSFPLSDISLRAVKDANFWQVSLSEFEV